MMDMFLKFDRLWYGRLELEANSFTFMKFIIEKVL